MGLTPEAYSDVFDWLERGHVRYVVIGGVAVVLRGHVRPIADLDFAVNRAPDEMSRAMSALSALGFVPSIPLPLSALTVLRLFDQSQREINIIVRPYVPFADLWAGSEHICLGNGVARVASLEHLVQAKRVNGRPRDMLDIRGLLKLEAGNGGQDSAAPAAADKQNESR